MQARIAERTGMAIKFIGWLIAIAATIVVGNLPGHDGTEETSRGATRAVAGAAADFVGSRAITDDRADFLRPLRPQVSKRAVSGQVLAPLATSASMGVVAVCRTRFVAGAEDGFLEWVSRGAAVRGPPGLAI